MTETSRVDAPSSFATVTVSIALGNRSFEASGALLDVERLLDKFTTLLDTTAEAPPPSPIEEGDSAAPPADQGAPDNPPPSLAEFLGERTHLKQNANKLTAIVTWATRYGGKDSIGSSEIADLWKRKTTLGTAPGNSARDLGTAVKKGWLHSEGAGSAVRYKPNHAGELMVDGGK